MNDEVLFDIFFLMVDATRNGQFICRALRHGHGVRTAGRLCATKRHTDFICRDQFWWRPYFPCAKIHIKSTAESRCDTTSKHTEYLFNMQ